MNDIPNVFQICNHKIYSVDLKISREPSETATQDFEELSKNAENAFDSQNVEGEKIQDDSSNGEEGEEEKRVLKKSEIPRVDIINQQRNDSKINPLDAPNFVDICSEENRYFENKLISLVTRKKLKKEKQVLSVMDVLLSMALITPLTVGFWRGTWTLMDLHFNRFLGIVGFFCGILVHTVFAVFKNSLHARSTGPSRKRNWESKALFKTMQILYTYIFGVACNAHWRGGWIIFDHFCGGNIWMIVGVVVVTLIILTVLQSIRNLLAVPTMVAIDKFVFTFHFPTRYKLNTRDWSLYLLDCAFSVGVVGTLVVFVWRGVWILFDLYLFPGDREYSAIGSLAIGYAIVTVTFSLQPLMRYMCARLQGLARLIVADGFLLLSFLGTVNVWRGIWNVLDLWLVPENPEMSCWITHVGCFVFLVLLNCSNSILVRGVYIDAEEDDGKCVVFPCHYLRLFFKVEREKKEARRRNLLVASKDFRPRADGNAKDTENGALLPNSTTTTILPTNPESLV